MISEKVSTELFQTMSTAIQTLTEKASKLSVIGAHQAPLKSAGSLDKYEKFDVTPVIGTEFKDAQLSSLLDGPDSDRGIRDLGILGCGHCTASSRNPSTYYCSTSSQCPSVVLYFSVRRISTSCNRRSSVRSWESSLESLKIRAFTCTP